MDTSQLFANFNRVITANAVAGLANVCATIWFARVLGPGTLGDYAVLMVTFQLVTALLVPGFNQALIREPSRNELVAAATAATCVQSCVIGAVAALFALFSFWLGTDQIRELVCPGLLLGGALVVTFWSNLLASPLEASLAYGSLSVIRIVSIGGGIGVGLVGASRGWGIYALVVRDVVTAVVALALVVRKSPLVLAWRRWKQGIHDLLWFSAGMWALNGLEKLALRIDYAIVGVVFDKEALGIYFAVRGLVEGALGFVVSPIQTVLYSFYCRMSVSTVRLWPRLINIAGGLVGLVVAVECLCLFVGAWFVETFFGAQYRSGEALLAGLVLYAGAMLWFETVKVWAMSRDLHRTMVLPRVVQLASLLATTFPLIRAGGLGGAGLAAGLSASFLAVIATWQAYRQAAMPRFFACHKKVGERAA